MVGALSYLGTVGTLLRSTFPGPRQGPASQTGLSLACWVRFLHCPLTWPRHICSKRTGSTVVLRSRLHSGCHSPLGDETAPTLYDEELKLSGVLSSPGVSDASLWQKLSGQEGTMQAVLRSAGDLVPLPLLLPRIGPLLLLSQHFCVPGNIPNSVFLVTPSSPDLSTERV